MKEKARKLNNEIRAQKVQLITDEWENLWEMSLSEAKQKAVEQSLDLMEIWRNWDVVIVKILDYGKHLYRQKKQERKNKSKWKSPDLKTIRITFKIGEHDLEIKKKQAEKFSKGQHPLKISLMLRWRENHYIDLARDKITGFVKSLDEIYKLDWTIKQNRNTFLAMLKPLGK